MKKILFLTLVLLLSSNVFAIDEKAVLEENSIQTRINNVAAKILNENAYDI